nr:PREDICTED: uncharacterized protein LOC108952645 [Musa acuminata subsp. malaccensis]
MYFEDFMASCSESSLISDATSYTAWKPSESNGCRKLRLKKRKQRNFVDDDDPLGDTATSPFDSFKDCELRDVSTNRRKKDDPSISSQEEDTGCRNERESENENVFEFIERSNRCADLNKRGLCLVPFSLLGCYLR